MLRSALKLCQKKKFVAGTGLLSCATILGFGRQATIEELGAGGGWINKRGAGNEIISAGYYCQSCYSTQRAAEKQAALITGKVFH